MSKDVDLFMVWLQGIKTWGAMNLAAWNYICSQILEEKELQGLIQGLIRMNLYQCVSSEGQMSLTNCTDYTFNMWTN